MNNIYFLAKQQNTKLKTLETKAGLSAGYLARLNKETSKTIPGMDVLVSLSNTLGVSMDSLIECDFETMSATDRFIYEFLEKLILDTDSQKLLWEKATAKDLLSLERDFEHPLIVKRSQGNSYRSLFRPYDRDITLFGCQYHVKIGKETYVYLMNTSFDCETHSGETVNAGEFELYLIHHKTVKGICRTIFGQSTVFTAALSRLELAAENSTRHIRIDADVKNIIEEFMSDKEVTTE